MTINSPAASLMDLEGDDMRLIAGNMNKSSSLAAHPELPSTYPLTQIDSKVRKT